MGDELVARLDRAGEASLVLLDVGRVAGAECAHNLETGRVPRVQAMHDGTAEAHLLTGLRRGMKRVVVAVEAVQERRLSRSLVLEDHVGLGVLWRREVDCRGALGAAPVALADEEGAGVNTGVDIVAVGVNELRLDVKNGAGLALVVDADNFGTDLKVAALGSGGERLDELNLALAVDDSSVVKLGDVGDSGGLVGGVKVNYLLCIALESYGGDLISGWIVYLTARHSLQRMMGYVGKAAKLGCNSYNPLSAQAHYMMIAANSYVEEVKLVRLGTNRVGKQQQVSLKPGHLLARIFEADTGTGHDGR